MPQENFTVLQSSRFYYKIFEAVTTSDLKKRATTVSPTVTGLTITPTDWQNLYFKVLFTIVGLSGITLQI